MSSETRESSESNPTIFSVFVTSALHKMSVWENIAYLVSIVLGSLANCVCLTIVSRSTVFHANLQCPIWWTAFSYFQLALSKGLFIIFQIVYLQNENEPTGGAELIALSAMTHYFFIFTTMCSPMIVVLERSVATICLFDYEKKKRRVVLISLLLLQIAFAVFFTFLSVSNCLRFISASIMAGIIAAGSLVIFIHINRINTATLKFVECRNRDIKFNLSARYQLRENVKTFKMLKTLFMTFTAMIMIMTILKMIPMIIVVGEGTRDLFFKITDMLVHAGPIYITITLITAVEDYRKTFYRLFGLDYCAKHIIPKTGKKDEDVYFEQFQATLK